MPKINVMVERCKGCERCNDACPQAIVKMSGELNAKGYNYSKMTDPPRCIGCRMCAISCPDSAIEVFVEGTQYEFFAY
ncbi:MAG: 4Fe-4S dicluster domain-containing protein [Deltaproteobacteria bacterium]|nr:4Fe-4S dicluster domain-containing protein [Deltaproteobacteria bacterium]